MTERPASIRTLSPALVAVMAVIVLLLVHPFLISTPADVTGWRLIAVHAADVAAVTVTLLVAAAVGRLVLRLLAAPLESPLDTVLYGTPVGLGVLAFCVLALGVVGGLNGAVLTAVLVIGAVGAHREIHSIWDLVRERVASAAVLTRSPLALIAIILSGVVLFLGAILALAPPTDWDSLMYHLEIPTQFLERGAIFVPPDNLHVAFVGLVHMIYLPLLALGGPAAPALFSLVLAGLLVAAVAAAARRWFGRSTAALAVILLWSSTSILLVAVTPRVDVTLSLYLLLAHCALLRGMMDGNLTRWSVLAGALIGLAVGVKLNALAYAAALAPVVLWLAAQHRSPRALVAFGGVALLTAAPWLIKNWMLLGAPLHPYFAERLLEPWLQPLLGSVTVPPGIDDAVFGTLRVVRARFDLLAAFFNPGRLTVEPEGLFYGPGLALLAFPLWLITARRRIETWLAVPALVYLAIVVLPFGTTNLRYLIPMFPAVALVTARALTALGERRHRWPALVGLAAAVVVVVSLVNPARVLMRRTSNTRAVQHVVGSASRDAYLENHYDVAIQFLWAAANEANRELGPQHRLLLLFESRGYYFDIPLYQDNRVANWPLLAATPMGDRCLSNTEVTHVLIGIGVANYYVSRGLDPNRVRWSDLDAFVARCLVGVYQNRGVLVFRVRDGAVQPADSPPP